MNAPAKRISVRYFASLRDALLERGMDLEPLFRMAGLPPTRFEADADGLLPLEVESFIAAYRRLTGRTDLGFDLGLLIKMTSHDLLGYGMLSCRNFEELLGLVSRHYHLMTEAFKLRYVRSGAVGEAVYTPAIAMPLEMMRFHIEAVAVSHQNQMQMMFGPVDYDIHMGMAPPPHAARYLALSPVRFHFDERALPGVRVVMPRELLQRPLPLHDARTVRQIEQRLERQAPRMPDGDKGWGDYITMLLREAEGAQITLETLAQRTRVSARTIDRHLKKENLQFRDLVQQVRFEQARAWLRQPGATVAQVALRSGFSDAANFGRAFKRAMGVSPGEYQRGEPGEDKSTPD